MNSNLFLALILCIIWWNTSYSQSNSIAIDAILNTETHEIKIQQEILFYNKSDSLLKEIYLHNWPNAFKDKNTPLAKRFIENYTKAFHFAPEKQRGRTVINSIAVNYDLINWEITDDNPDIVKIPLLNKLKPGDSVKITASYLVKIPKDKFTRYGFNEDGYNLKYWYLTPAIFDKIWHTYNNLGIDDLYMDHTNYHIEIEVPKDYSVNTDLEELSNKTNSQTNNYVFTGENRFDVALNITKNNDFINYSFDETTITTNLHTDKLSHSLKTSILKREFYFIQLYLSKYPHKKLLLNNIDYSKNPVYGFNQLPTFLAPFTDTFEWDIKMFKVLLKKYIATIFLFDKREDVWLADGLHTYLMIKYVERYYPEVKAIGGISKLWGIRNFNLAQIDFNDKYPFVYQFAARKNLDQPLTLRADSLSNFNRKIVNKYKAGLGLNYLETYLDDLNFSSIIYTYSKNFSGKKATSNAFLDLLKNNSEKDISWFENDYLKTSKKIDYTIQKIVKKNDSLEVAILNKRNFTAPIQLYGIKDKEIKFKKWITGVDSLTKVTIPTNGFDQLSLNYESLLPEYNLRNNWKRVQNNILNRPIKLKFLKDIENPYFNEFFYTPVARYNYYDGVVIGMAISNKTILNKSFQYKLTPSYSTKSKSFSSFYSLLYEFLPENKKINKFLFGISGANYHYAENLTYTTLYPFALLEFKRKSLRKVESKAIVASYAFVDRERSPTQTQHIETNKYNVFSLSYGYSSPEIIDDIRFSTGFQVSNKFSKLTLTARYRKLTDTNRQFDFRFFAGTFLTNNTETDYFSFALDRPTDYLFQYDYLGRSETSGIFSQQVIINEGGFKSKLPVAYGNQWLTTVNTSVGLWRWFEVYNDIGFVKNKNKKAYFAHENGFRLNFIQDILEVYFPLHSNLGWEISQPSYSSKIRFVLVIKPKRIYNFIRRGFY